MFSRVPAHHAWHQVIATNSSHSGRAGMPRFLPLFPLSPIFWQRVWHQRLLKYLCAYAHQRQRNNFAAGRHGNARCSYVSRWRSQISTRRENELLRPRQENAPASEKFNNKTWCRRRRPRCRVAATAIHRPSGKIRRWKFPVLAEWKSLAQPLARKKSRWLLRAFRRWAFSFPLLFLLLRLRRRLAPRRAGNEFGKKD